MFGYLDIQKDLLEDGQRGLWQTFMCGLCFSTKKLLGNLPRMFISNDVNFFNVLFTSVLGQDVTIEHSRCFSHPVKKRTVINPTDLTDKLAVGNVLLTYWNVYDDVVDGGSAKKKLALKAIKKAYQKAQKQMPNLDKAIATRYMELRSLEQSDCSSIDMVSHSFACLSQDFCRQILGDKATEYALTLCYNLGKWIYLIDALDDAQKDAKTGNYNPFLSCYGAKSAQELANFNEEIGFTMYAVLNRIAQSYNDLNLTKYTCILQNVVYNSIRNKTKQALEKLN